MSPVRPGMQPRQRPGTPEHGSAGPARHLGQSDNHHGRGPDPAEAAAPGMPAYLSGVQQQADGGTTPGMEGCAVTGNHGGITSDGPAPATADGAKPRRIRALADAGIATAGDPLPDRDRIQSAFGHHDLSGVRVQIGGAGGGAAAGMGARAYTLGERIAFRRTPDLRLAAHEAAHVVQQRQGARLDGGVGKAGDAYERHADAVAQRVVNGESAQDLLDGSGQRADGSPGTHASVQHECECGGSCSSCRKPEEEEPAGKGVQMELEADATRLFEPEVAASGQGETLASAAPAMSSEATGEEGLDGGMTPASGMEPEAAASDGAAGDAASTSAPGMSGGSSAASHAGGESGGRDASVSTAGASGAAHAPGGAADASCYRADIEEPTEEPETEPAEPPRGEVEESGGVDLAEPEGGDNCPVGEAMEASGDPATAMAEGAGADPATVDAPAAGGAGGGGSGRAAAASPSGAGGGGGGGGGGGAEQAPASAGAFDGAIAQTEAEREGALTGYAGAGLRIDEVAAVARTHAAPVDMATSDPGQRRIASAASDFFRASSARLEEVLVQSRTTIPTRLGGVARGIKADIGAAIEGEKTAISSRIAAARAQARGAARAASGRIEAAHAASVGQVEAAAEAAQAALDAAYPGTTARIDDAESAGLDDINQAYADSRANHESIGQRIGAEATARGSEYSAGYGNCKINRRDSWTAGYLTDRRAEAQQEAATKTAEGYRTSLEEAGRNAGRDLAREGRPRDRCGLIAIANRARGSLDTQYTALAAAIGSARTGAIAQADAARDQLLASVEGALASTLGQLDAQERSQRQAANDTGYLQQLGIEQAAHAAATSALNAVADAVESVSGLLGSARAGMRDLGDADPAAATAHFGRLRENVEAGIARLAVQAMTGGAMAEARLMGNGSAAISAMAMLAESHATQTSDTAQAHAQGVGSIAGSGAASLRQQGQAASDQLLDIGTSGVTAFDTIAGGVESGAATMLGNIQGTLASAEADLETQLRTTLGDLDSTSKGIPYHARVAASKEQPAWKSVVKWVLIIAIVIVVALVIGPAVIGAVGAAAGALGASAAAASVIGTVVGGAIVGAATSATIQVINNWAAGVSLTTGVGRAAIMGAIGGAFGGAAGQLIGRAAQVYQLSGVTQFALNIVSDTVLEIGTSLVTGEFSWEALGMSVLMSVATGGFGEIPRVRAVQARVQHFGATRVPGAGAARFAESIRPPSPAPTPRSAVDVEVAGTPKAAAASEAPSSGPTRAVDAEGGAPVRPSEGGASPKATAEADAGGTGPRAADADSATTARDGAGGTPHQHEDVDAAAGRAASNRADGPELDAPARSKSDAELVESTAARSQVGDEAHVNSFRRNGDRIECEICSAGCGRVRHRVSDMRNQTPDTPENVTLRQKLQELEGMVAAIEQRLESPGSGVTQREVIDASAAIAQRFREIGESFPTIGKGIDDPSVMARTYDMDGGHARGHEPVRTDNLQGLSTGKRVATPRQDITMDNLGSLNIPKNHDVLYVLRDVNTGAILKVGKTTATRAPNRFNVYRSAGDKLGLDLRLEVTTVPPPTARSPQKIEFFESQLRARVEREGHIMPWDNSGEYVPSLGTRQGRLGRAGPGTPFDSRRAALRKSHEWNDQGWLVPRATPGG